VSKEDAMGATIIELFGPLEAAAFAGDGGQGAVGVVAYGGYHYVLLSTFGVDYTPVFVASTEDEALIFARRYAKLYRDWDARGEDASMRMNVALIDEAIAASPMPVARWEQLPRSEVAHFFAAYATAKEATT
jgi:hypothetical protein